jgi:hypothetical protein
MDMAKTLLSNSNRRKITEVISASETGSDMNQTKVDTCEVA